MLSWLELLEEYDYLIQMLFGVVHDQGALEHTCYLLQVLRADLRADAMQVGDIERKSRESSATVSKVYYSASTTSPDMEKDDYGLKRCEKQDHLLGVWTMRRTLSIEVRNLEIKAQILRRQKRQYDELQRRLVTLFSSITEPRKHPSHEEEEAERDASRAQHNLYEAQKTLDRNKTLEVLLRHGDYSLINAGRHLTGGSGGSSGVDAAMKCAVQTSIVVNQARRLDPSFFEQEDAEALKVGWLHEVFQATSADDSHPHQLLQALKPHHTALQSLIPQAHMRKSESDAAVHRAAHQSSEANARRDAVRRRVILRRASAEAERDSEMSLGNTAFWQDGVAKMRNITTGLEVVIPIAGVLRSSATVSTPYSSEERRQIEPASRPSPIFVPQTRASRLSRQLPSNLTQDLAPSLRSAPLPTPPSTSDPRTHAPRGALDKQLYQPSSAAPQPHTADPTQRRFPPADMIRQPKPIHQQNRHPVLDQQYDRPWQAELGDQNDPNLRSQGKVPSKTSDRAIRTFQSQAQAHPGQPLQDVRASPPSSIPKLPIQQNARSLQPQLSDFSNPSADSRPPSAPKQKSRSGTAEYHQMLSHSLHSQPLRPRPLPPTNATPPHQSDSRDPKPPSMAPTSSSQLSGGELRMGSDSSRSSPKPLRPRPLPPANATPSHQSDSCDPKPTSIAPPSSSQLSGGELRMSSDSSRSPPKPPSTSTASLPSHRPVVHGILKQAPSRAADADPWGLGVKAAPAPPPLVQPKLKNVFNLWRTAETSTASRLRGTPQPEPQTRPPLAPKQQNPRAAMRMLRFSEGVEIIPRPTIDSDPYEEDEEEDQLPPSPRRGSMTWLDTEKVMRESSDDSSGDFQEATPQRDIAEVPINPGFVIDPSSSSISNPSSSTHLTDYLTHSTLSSSTMPPPPQSSGSSLQLLSYYTSQDNGWTPPQDQLDMLKGNGDHSERIVTGAREGTSWDPPASGWTSRVYTTSPQPLSDHIRKDDDSLRTDTGSNNADSGRLMSSPGPNAVPNPTASYNMTKGSTRSDHELLQTIFPSPAHSSISQRDLMFIS